MKNIDRYKYKRFILLLLGILFSPISWIIPKNNKRIIFSSTVNSYYNYNSKYIFEYFKEKYPEYEIKFVLNDEKTRENLKEQIGGYFINTQTLKGIFYCLRAKTWIVSSLETPVGGIFLRVNRLVIHLGHGTPLKNIGFLEKNIGIVKKIYYTIIKNNFTYILSTSHNFDTIMMNFLKVSRNRIFTNGQPRNDSIFIDKKNFLREKFIGSKDSTNILYAPTWRQKKETLLFPFKDFELQKLGNYLKENKINIFLRLHPDFEDKVSKELLKIKNIYLFNKEVAEDITEYLSCFDMLITDYSSIYIDYLLLNRPILYIPYDYEEYNEEIGFTVNYNEHTPGPKIKSFENFTKEILKFKLDKEYFESERIKENKFYNICIDKTNCEKISKFIIQNIEK